MRPKRLETLAIFLDEHAIFMKNKQPDYLKKWVGHPQADKLFGASFALRADVLGVLLTKKGTLAQVAAKYGKTRQCAAMIAKTQRAVLSKLI